MMPAESFSTLLSDRISTVRLGQFSNCSNSRMRLKLTATISNFSDFGRSVSETSLFSLISRETSELHWANAPCSISVMWFLFRLRYYSPRQNWVCWRVSTVSWLLETSKRFKALGSIGSRPILLPSSISTSKHPSWWSYGSAIISFPLRTSSTSVVAL